MIVSKEKQRFFMRQALSLAKKGRLLAPPNPWVGCVIVQQGAIVGQGYTAPFGGPHAERAALEEAKERAKGATAYISLEPCAHVGKTAACTTLLRKAGIKEVVIPLLDPDPKVAGRGVAALEEGGIKVTVGLCKNEAKELLLPYLHHRKTKMPYTLLKAAISLDGKIAAKDGTSKWITGEEARADVHLLRAESGAILVGSETFLRDAPKLTVRGLEKEHRQPLRVILDRRGRLSPQSENTLHITQDISLRELLLDLGKRGVVQLLVEGGGQVHSSFLRSGLANKLILYQSGLILGSRGVDLFPDLSIASMAESKRVSLCNRRPLGSDIRLDYQIASTL